MNRSISILLLAVAVSHISAFTVSVAPSTRIAHSTVHRNMDADAASLQFSTSCSTALQMVKVKVDPNEKEERINPAVFKNAAYLGSIAVAVLLPLIFLLLKH